jgi:hypothetical protein
MVLCREKRRCVFPVLCGGIYLSPFRLVDSSPKTLSAAMHTAGLLIFLPSVRDSPWSSLMHVRHIESLFAICLLVYIFTVIYIWHHQPTYLVGYIKQLQPSINNHITINQLTKQPTSCAHLISNAMPTGTHLHVCRR